MTYRQSAPQPHSWAQLNSQRDLQRVQSNSYRFQQISIKLALLLRGAPAQRSNLDRSSARWPKIASLSLAMTVGVNGAT